MCVRRHILAGEGRAAFLSDYLGSKDLLDPLLISHVENHSKMSRADQLDAYDFIGALRPVMDKIAGQYECLITPSVTSEAPVTEEPMRFTGDAVRSNSLFVSSQCFCELLTCG